MVDAPESLLRQALLGDTNALQSLLNELASTIRARVFRILVRQAARGKNRDMQQEVEDLTQDVLLLLISNDASALRGWDPSRGCSLVNYVGIIAEREAIRVVRSGKKNPFRMVPTPQEDLDKASGWSGPESSAVARDFSRKLRNRLESELSPQGKSIFEMLFLELKPVEHVCEAVGMQPDAVYAWRSRLMKRMRELSEGGMR